MRVMRITTRGWTYQQSAIEQALQLREAATARSYGRGGAFAARRGKYRQFGLWRRVYPRDAADDAYGVS